jgi:hypothetical protein
MHWDLMGALVVVSFFQSMLIGSVSGIGLRLILRNYARQISRGVRTPAGELFIKGTLALLIFIWLGYNVTSFKVEYIPLLFRITLRSGIIALVQWLILRRALPMRGIKWGVLWFLGVWVGTGVGDWIGTCLRMMVHGSTFISDNLLIWILADNITPGLTVGAITGYVLLRFYTGSEASQPDLVSEKPEPPTSLSPHIRFQGHVIGSLLATFVWLALSPVVLIGGGYLLKLPAYGSGWQLLIPSSFNMAISLALTVGVGCLALCMLGFLFGPFLMNDFYAWVAHRSKKGSEWLHGKMLGISKTIVLSGAALLLTITVGILGIKNSLFKPRFEWYLWNLVEISAPCPTQMDISCEWIPDWPYYDVWLTARWFGKYPDQVNDGEGANVRLLRIKIDKYNDDQYQDN